MIRRSLMRSFNTMLQTSAKNAKASLTLSTLARAFATSGRFGRDDSSYGQEYSSPRRSQGYSARDPEQRPQYSREPRQPMAPRRQIPHQADVFKKMYTLGSSELFNLLSSPSETGDYQETKATDFANSLQNKESFLAWKALEDVHKNQFIDNVFALSLESMTNRSFFPNIRLMRFIIDCSLRALDNNALVHFLKSLPASSGSHITMLRILNVFFQELERKRNYPGLYKIKEAFRLAEETMYQAYNQGIPERSQSKLAQNYYGLASYLACASIRALGSNSNYCRNLQSAFLNQEPGLEDRQSLLHGAAAILLMYDHQVPAEINNEHTLSMLNGYIDLINEDTRKRKNTGYDSGIGLGNGEVAPETESIPLISHLRLNYPPRFLSLAAVVQGLTITEHQDAPIPAHRLTMIIEAIPAEKANYKFKRWLSNMIISKENPATNLESALTRARAASKFVSMKRFPQVVIYALKDLANRKDQIRTSKDHVHALMCAGSPYRQFKTQEQETPEEGATQPARITEADKEVISTFFEEIYQRVLQEDMILGMEDGLKAIVTILRHSQRLTAEEMKATALHKNVWENISKKNAFTDQSGLVLKAINSYNLVNDESMQQILVDVLPKMAARPNEKYPEREVFNKYYRELDRIEQTFNAQAATSAGLTPLQKQVVAAIEAYTQKIRPLKSQEPAEPTADE